jgi:mono/diheme cytochrome c family protein
MSRTAKLLLLPAALLVMIVTAACGTERLGVAKNASEPAGGDVYHGAVLFSQRCAGCHTLSYAGTHGSAPNIRDAQGNSGPDFDQRCERPIDRVLYAIENGGFSGAYMPQNIVVGHDAVDVAKFVATYSGRQIPAEPGLVKCQNEAMGKLPADTDGLKPSDQVGASSTSFKGRASHAAPVADSRGHAKKHAA